MTPKELYREERSIMAVTWCIHCDKEYRNPSAFQRHVLRFHPNSYHARAIKRCRDYVRTHQP